MGFRLEFLWGPVYLFLRNYIYIQPFFPTILLLCFSPYYVNETLGQRQYFSIEIHGP